MTLHSSEFPWYVWVHKEGKDIVIQKYESKEMAKVNSYLDMMTIDENSTNHNILKNYVKSQFEKLK